MGDVPWYLDSESNEDRKLRVESNEDRKLNQTKTGS